tara:strand:- start:542 stop:751 length:210 start_codon:yes stop_codon:yes gene_type:complete
MNFFKAKRIEKKLSISDVVYNTNYPISVIEAIEKDKINFLPKPYAYYAAKTYAKYLNILNADEIIKKYK